MSLKQMNQKKLFSISWKLGLLVLIGSGVSIFQNCSQPSGGSSLDAETVAAEQMAFSYDTTIDEIAYMSCPLLTAPYDLGTYFTFRAGAYRTGGIKLTDLFFQNYGKRPVDSMANMLTLSPANSNTVLQLAIRQVGNLNSLVIGSAAPTAGVDYDNMLDTLGTMDMNLNLISTGMNSALGTITETRTKYLRNGTFQGAHLEGSLQFGTSEALQSSVRSTYLVNQQAMLTVTYNEPGQSTGGSSGTGGSSSGSGTGSGGATTNVRTPTTAFPNVVSASPTPALSTAGSAYGLGFKLGFVQPSLDGAAPVGLLAINPATLQQTGQQSEPYPLNIMNSVQETNLLSVSTASTTGTWVCPQDLQFKIVRPQDLPAPSATPSEFTYPCVTGPDPEPASADLTIARNTLRVEDWYIDMNNHCIVPKNSAGSCYGALNYVNYDYTTPTYGCDPNSTTTSNAANSPVCLAWASICYRLPQ